MNEKTEVDALKEELKSLKDDIAALTAAVEDLTQNKTRENAQEDIQEDDNASVAEQLEEDFKQYKEEGEALVQSIDSSIRTNPVRSVLVALGVGYVMARIMGRK